MEQFSRKPHAQSTYSGILARSIITWANMTSTEKALMIMSTRSTIWRSSFGSVDSVRFLCHHYDENDPKLTFECK